MLGQLLLLIVFVRSSQSFYIENSPTENSVEEPEPCNAGCQNGGQCFLSSFCICPRGFSGRYCEIILREQCGTFSSTFRIEINCVVCICYNGLFACDVKPTGLCQHRRQPFLTRTQQIHQTLALIKQRHKNIRAFQPMSLYNISIDDRVIPILNGYRILLNRSTFSTPSLHPIILSFFFLYIYFISV